ncbi:MAG: glucose-1-phosphate adenylyltransferase subunit GlgD [Lachnospiraceae bacterium]|nr:glucose-1-phosphate adenylyltransferase subunit GlgD [Lachnospiraceae bacterium]MBQ4242514.1 glucose-1-phosphate adenylyltransferase subunit GlgD [Lachnospiraceae bacterium]MBQ5533706.1 glucose-1-phosphate adenylyltransferase subunit GlgD [Lachnospiraceae bacterium]
MARAFGIITPSGKDMKVHGMDFFRPISAFSFLGRYRLVDFPVSNMSNSGIEHIQVYVSQNPRSLAEHLGTGRTYNINSKRGQLQLLFNQDSRVNEIYNTDIRAYADNMDQIEIAREEYVIISPGYMIFKEDYSELLQAHVESGADITVLYHKVDNADRAFRNCRTVDLNRQKGVKTIGWNDGSVAEKNIFMDTYVMKRELFIELIFKAQKLSSVYRLVDIINDENDDLDIRGIAHKGYFTAVTDFKSYYDANLELLDFAKAKELFTEEWPIYTVTTDSCPVRYVKGSKVKNSMVANGCVIEGSVENSVVGRGVQIKKGASVKNCVILGHSVIGEGVKLEGQVVDKWAKIINVREVVAPMDNPGYVTRGDTL